MNRINSGDAFAPVSGGIQEPLLAADQLVPGVFVTATTANICWEVLEAPVDGIVVLRPHNLPAPPADHICRLDRYSNIQCRCGKRRQQVVLLLPVAEGPRCTIIKTRFPADPLIIPNPNSIYGLVNIRVMEYGTNLPVITRAVELWAPPAELVEAMARLT